MMLQSLFPMFFKFFALLLEFHQTPVPSMYMDSLFPPLLVPALWEKSGNIPALVRLLQAYFTKCSNEIANRNHLPGVLGIFQKLNASKANDHHGFALLSSIFEYLPLDQFRQYLPEILKLIFIRLTQKAIGKYIKAFIQCFSIFIFKRGAVVVIDACNSLQLGLFDMVIKSLWIEYVNKISGNKERKLCAVATIKLLTETPQMLSPGSNLVNLWPVLLTKLIALLEAEPEKETDDNDILKEQTDYSAVFVPLQYAKRVQYSIFNALPENPKQYLAVNLNNLYGNAPVVVQALRSLQAGEKNIIAAYFTQNGLTPLF